MGRSREELLFGLIEIPAEHGELSTDKPARFWALDSLTFEPHTTCNFCQSNPFFLRYELLANGGPVRGGCCLRCFPNPLRKVKHCGTDGVGTSKEYQVKFVAHILSIPMSLAQDIQRVDRGRQAQSGDGL